MLTATLVPTTIRAHVKGGLGELTREVARRGLEDLTPPYKPNQGPQDYLQAFFRSALASVRQRPKLARLVILELTEDPLLSVTFAERMFATIASLAAEADLIWGLELLIGRLTEVTMIESGAWARRDPKHTVSHIQMRLVSASKTEFPSPRPAHSRGEANPEIEARLPARAGRCGGCGVGCGTGGERLLAKSMSATSRSRRGPNRPKSIQSRDDLFLSSNRT